jgi:hypothetical protein
MPAALNLIVQYCNTANPQRQKEYDFCVQQNIANPHIAAVHNLVEPKTVVPEAIRTNPKYRELRIDQWLTYDRAFRFANETLKPGTTCCLCNLDIFLDRDSDWTGASDMTGTDDRVVLCLSRHEFDGVGQARIDESLARGGLAHTQDAWIFRTPMDVRDCDFEIGLPGCDNAIAHRIRRSGYVPVNSPLRYKVIHYDLCSRSSDPKKRWEGQASRVTNRHPEKEGQLLLPAMEYVPSLDKVLDQLNVPPLRRYEIACEIVSRYVKVSSS